MDDQENAQTLKRRQIVAGLDQEFARFHVNACALIAQISTETLYAVPTAKDPTPTPILSVGESVLRGAAAIEQTFGGITANLWDDPFEWTLPEYLSTPEKVIEHLAEVEATRARAFSSFIDDDCLRKHIAVPAGGTRPLIELLRETLRKATDREAQAGLALKILSEISKPGFIM
jgi:hypothetical protein